jgi:hypothetical protein
METAAARLGKSRRKELAYLPNLEATLDAILSETDNSGFLPSSSHIPSSFRWQDMLQATIANRELGQKHRKSGISILHRYSTGQLSFPSIC